ncbi:MAG: hypothetical protein ACUVS2_11660 [Candidatus Flexifilum sp.]
MRGRAFRSAAGAIGLALLALLGAGGGPVTGQPEAAIAVTVDAGFGGFYRPETWMPVRADLVNNGPDVRGQLLIRPETNPNAIGSAYATPVELAAGARQTVTLYVTARAFSGLLRVELLADDGSVIAVGTDSIRAVRAADRLYAVLTDAPAGPVDLTGARLGGAQAGQVAWRIADLPDRAIGLSALDLILFHDVDTSALTDAQRAALRDWTIAGGQIIAAGGPNWRATAAGLADLLPLEPAGARTVPDLEALARWLRRPATEAGALAGSAVVTDGAPIAGARILAALPDGAPLIVRRALGSGTVDYLTVDPGLAPLRGWAGLSDLWYTLHTARDPVPGWARGFTDWTAAQAAAEILPGFEPLPDALPLLLFLLAYIALIGPLNYIVLSHINRREWAWVTIPALILAFSIAAYALGIRIRGSDATLNRLTVVQRFPDTDRAPVDGLIGMLAPRRGQYTLTTDADGLRPIPAAASAGGGLLRRDLGAGVRIVETDGFAARDFTVDASYVAGFALNGLIAAPAVGGSAVFSYDVIAGQMTVRGSVTSDLDVVLHDPVILARGVSLRLPSALAPGAIETFTLTLPGEGVPSPVPPLPSPENQFNFRGGRGDDRSNQSGLDILGANRYIGDLFRLNLNPSVADQTNRRDTFFVNALVDDAYGATGRGDALYLAGWIEAFPLTVDLLDAGWESVGRTLVIARLDATYDRPPGRSITIPPERFTWALRTYTGLGEIVPVNLIMQPGDDVSFRFTPLPEARLTRVEAIRLRLDDLSVMTSRRIPIQVWNWDAGRWDAFSVSAQTFTLPDVEAYLGPLNAVEVRLVADEAGGFLRLGRLGIEQVGRF